MPMSRRTFGILLVVLLAVVASYLLPCALSGRPLETHEAFVAQTTREMLASGEYFVPRFGGELRLKKPPLMYWLVAATAAVTGQSDVHEWVARLPSVAAALVMIASCVLIGARVFDRSTGLLAGAFLGVSAIVSQYGDNARPEMLYAACCAIGCLGFLSAARTRGGVAWAWSLLGWTGFALALLAKGPQLPLLLLLGQGGYVLWTKGPREYLRVFRPLMATVVVCAIALPWVLIVMQRESTALAIWKHELIGLRFGGDDAAVKAGGGVLGWLKEVVKVPYLLYCVSTLLPWGVLAPLAFFVVWERGREDLRQARDVFFTFTVALVGLSFASHSRDYYLLPAVPLLAVLLARGTIEVLAKAERNSRLRSISSWGLEFLAFLGLVGAIGAAVRGGWNAWNTAMLLGGLVIGAAALITMWRHIGRGAFSTLLALTVVVWTTAFGVIGTDPAHWRTRHIALRDLGRAAANAAQSTSQPPLPVIAMGVDPNDLIYQVRHPVKTLPEDAPVAAAHAFGAANGCVIVGTPRALESLVAQGLTLSRGETWRIEGDFAATVAVVRGSNP